MKSYADRIAEGQKEAASIQPTEPLESSELSRFLPEPFAGWHALETQEPQVPGLTQVERTYFETENEDKSFRLQIADSGGSPQLYVEMVAMAYKPPEENKQGYEKGVLLDGHPGFVKYDHGEQSEQLSVFVAKRFLVIVDAGPVEEGFTNLVWEAIDKEALKALP